MVGVALLLICPQNARCYDSARCVRDPRPAVSNNSSPLLCTVNGRLHSCASLRYATRVPPFPDLYPMGRQSCVRPGIAPDWASPQAEDLSMSAQHPQPMTASLAGAIDAWHAATTDGAPAVLRRFPGKILLC